MKYKQIGIWIFSVFLTGHFNVPVMAQDDQQITSNLEIFNIETGERALVFSLNKRFEAPNWMPDGKSLLFNMEGKLYTIPVSGGKPQLLNTGFADQCNNDHGISPDGKQIVISHHERESEVSKIYILPITGGEPELITPKGPSYWHGWSPDGKTLAYVGLRNDDYDIYTIPVTGGEETRITKAKGLDDGPDYSPDGKYLYFNSVRTGRMQIYRAKPDGSETEQLTDDTYNDWFPHPSPDGAWVVFISYLDEIDPGSHPPDKNVMLRIMKPDGSELKELARFVGGQGTINVPSWSPDSKKFAFVSYQVK